MFSGQQQHQPQDDYWRDELGLAAAAVAAAAAVVPTEEDVGGMATHQQQAMVNRCGQERNFFLRIFLRIFVVTNKHRLALNAN